VPRGFPRLGIGFFAFAVVDLQAKRHSADYDPTIRLSLSDTRMAIRTSRRALTLFRMVPRERRIFLMLLLFPPR
jgi:hypothetical protein